MTRTTRITRILAAAAIVLVTGSVLAQGPRVANDAPGWRGAADATSTQAETRTQLRDPEADVDPDVDPEVAPIRDRVRDPAQHPVDVDDAAVRGPRPARAATNEAFGPRQAEVAKALGMTEEELRDAIAGGTTCAALAEEAGVSLDDMPTWAGRPDRPNRADGTQAGAGEPLGRMQQDAPRARRGGGRF